MSEGEGIVKYSVSDEELKHVIAKKTAQEYLQGFCKFTQENYERNWHHKLLLDKLEEVYWRVARGESPRLIIEMPPRHGKSEACSIKFPAWVLGKNPTWPIVVGSYGADLSEKFGRETKDLLCSAKYRELFPNILLRDDSAAKANWALRLGGSYRAVGVGGALTGTGFKIGLVDDPFKNREEAESAVYRDKVWNWFTSTFYTRQEGNAAIIVIMTRWHKNDLVGRLLDLQASNKKEGATDYDEWEVISFPAIAERDEEYRKIGRA